jgi:4-hydroxybenzoate polyprenyltransferase
MYVYFYASVIGLLFFLGALWKSQAKLHYILLHNILKFIIVAGGVWIVLIEPSEWLRFIPFEL